MKSHSNNYKVNPTYNVQASLRKLMLNLELEISYTGSSLTRTKAKLLRYDKYKNSTNNKYRNKYFNTLVKSQEEETYMNELLKTRDEIRKSLKEIFTKYDEIDYKVWDMYFIKNKKVDEIVDKTHYSHSTIKRMLNRYEQDLIPYLINEIKEK